MAAWPPPHGSAMAARRISGSPRSRRPRRAPGMRRSRPSRREQDAARSRARSRCARTNRAGRAPRREAPGPYATPGIAQARTCSPPGSRSCSTIRSKRSRRGRRCTRWCATPRAISCSTILGSTKTLIYLRPDCADLPYTLRAYFAYKMGLPYGFSKCSRGGGGHAPTCPQWFSLQNAEEAKPPPPPPPAAPIPPAVSGYFGVSSAAAPLAPPAPKRTGPAPSFAELVQIVSDSVHSASGRTALADNNTDYYPVPLSADTLRPGTVYADPYGHILMIVRRVAQTEGAAGIILAVDGQPDGTVARKRFWRGNFLFAQDPALGGPGFKRFRPVVVANGAMRRLANAEIAKNPQYADFSLAQSQLGVEDFYDRMDDVMSPSPLDPTRAMKEAITSLEEQVKVRVTSVENGRN